MSKPSVLILCILISTTVFSQKFTLTNERVGEVFYIGVRNEISCTVEGYACSSVVLSTKNGTIKHFEGCRFFYFPDHVADDKITISIKKDGKLKKLSDYFVRIRASKPIATIGGFTDKYVSKKAFIMQTGIGSYLSYLETGLCINYTITSFIFIVLRNGVSVFTHLNKGNTWNEEIQNFFRTSLQHGDNIIICNIKAIGEEGKEMSLNALEYIIYDDTPTAELGGFPNGSHISRGAFMAQAGICGQSVGFSNMCAVCDLKVKNFIVTATRNNDTLFSLSCPSNIFTDEIRNNFRLLEKGDTITFSSVRVITHDGRNERPAKDFIAIIR